ncbi:hypothetical protein LTS18_011906 [Coniosporium uncinatum]|uniref:Uncharacterized protein n=1 Tax=Coniosporium uncinatum TaxID=93489 RepID=A0ACC3DD40_9PEZI|nr:hypothetical protein LTS18_011906 [Coniosporium uncinatum]
MSELLSSHSAEETRSRGHIQLGVSVAFIILSYIAVTLRLYVRGCMIRSLGWDDYFMVATQILFTAFCATTIVIVHNGGGMLNPPIEKLQIVMDWVVAGEALYLLTILFLKISLCLFFLRILIKPWQRRTVYALMAVSTLMNLSHFFFVIFMCGPGNNSGDYLVNLWSTNGSIPNNSSSKNAHAINANCPTKPTQLALAYTQTAISVLTDWALTALAAAVLCKAKMATRAKLAVGFVVSLAAISSVASVVRFWYLDGLVEPKDFLWNAANINVVGIVEPGTGIVAGSLATLRPLFKKLFRQARSLGATNETGSSFGGFGGGSRLPLSRIRSLGSAYVGEGKSASLGSSNGSHHGGGAGECGTYSPWIQSHQGSQFTTTCVGGPEAEQFDGGGLGVVSLPQLPPPPLMAQGGEGKEYVMHRERTEELQQWRVRRGSKGSGTSSREPLWTGVNHTSERDVERGDAWPLYHGGGNGTTGSRINKKVDVMVSVSREEEGEEGDIGAFLRRELVLPPPSDDGDDGSWNEEVFGRSSPLPKVLNGPGRGGGSGMGSPLTSPGRVPCGSVGGKSWLSDR